MDIWLLNFLENSNDTMFWVSGILGTTLFALRMITVFFSGAMEIDDADIHSYEGGDDFHYHTVPSLKLFTLHSMSGFFMMFGWVGLACTHQFDLSYLPAIVIAFAAGVAVMFLVALIFRGALFFEGSGDVFMVHKTVGLVGTVYQRIPATGQGKIQLMVNGVTRELLAQSHTQEIIESFALVKVVKVIDHEVVEVEKL
ncbi:MAG: hypothetical protein NTX86_02655 [Candidatus Dependentiae bacterium]|nr:hypothetical protein [Candidatus Dependentiae bacterium]